VLSFRVKRKNRSTLTHSNTAKNVVTVSKVTLITSKGKF